MGRGPSVSVLTAAALAFLLPLAGCHVGVHYLDEPVRNRVLMAQSGERFYFDLPEGGPSGLRWSATSSDDDVSVTLDHDDDHASVRILVHRGFDGPAHVVFRPRQKSGRPPAEIVLSFYKETGDRAFWE